MIDLWGFRSIFDSCQLPCFCFFVGFAFLSQTLGHFNQGLEVGVGFIDDNDVGVSSENFNDVDSVFIEDPLSLASSVEDHFSESPSVIDHIDIIPNGFLKMRLGLSSFDGVVGNLENAACSPPFHIDPSWCFVLNVQR